MVRHSSRDVAEHYHLSSALMANVLKELARGNFLGSARGPRGGYFLEKDPKSIFLGQLVEFLEGPLHLASCVEESDLACQASQVCTIKRNVFKIHHQIRDILYRHSVLDLCGIGEAGQGQSLPLAQRYPSARELQA